MAAAGDEEEVGVALAVLVRRRQIEFVKFEANLTNFVVLPSDHQVADALGTRGIREVSSVLHRISAALEPKVKRILRLNSRVYFCLSYLKKQQTPNPEAQVPSAIPPRFSQSVCV